MASDLLPSAFGRSWAEAQDRWNILKRVLASRFTSIDSTTTAISTELVNLEATYRTLLHAGCRLDTGTALNYYRMAGPHLQNVAHNAAPAGDNLPAFLTLVPGQYSISGRTTKLRIRAAIATNATKPAIKFSVGLYKIAAAGGANALQLSSPGVVEGTSEAVIESPNASSLTKFESADFAMPTEGTYMLMVLTSAALTANASVAIDADLLVRNV